MANPEHILYLVSRLEYLAGRFIVNELGKRGLEGLEPSHGAILRQLYLNGPLSMSRLAELIDRTRPTVTVLVRKLTAGGWVEKIQSDDDRRVTLVDLTDQTREHGASLFEISEQMRGKLYQGFSPAEQQALVDLLNRAIGNMQRE